MHLWVRTSVQITAAILSLSALENVRNNVFQSKAVQRLLMAVLLRSLRGGKTHETHLTAILKIKAENGAPLKMHNEESLHLAIFCTE